MLELKPDRLGREDFNSHTLAMCGRSFVADQSGALYWPGERTLVIADLHLEKGSSFAVRGQMLPPYDTRETLVRLAETIDTYEPQTVIALGDSLHDRSAAERIQPADLDVLRIIQENRRWLWVTGNHDPDVPARLGGDVVDEITVSGMRFAHIPRNGRATHEIAGHLHPAAKLSFHGYTIRRPCFVGNGRRLVLPAFGTFTGGLNVLDDAFEPLFRQ